MKLVQEPFEYVEECRYNDKYNRSWYQRVEMTGDGDDEESEWKVWK